MASLPTLSDGIALTHFISLTTFGRGARSHRVDLVSPRCSGRTGRSSVGEVPAIREGPRIREEVVAPARTN